MQVRTFDVISISEMSWGFCDNESRILKFGFILSCFVFITSVGVRDSLLYYPSSPLEPFTALALARDANSSSGNILRSIGVAMERSTSAGSIESLHTPI